MIGITMLRKDRGTHAWSEDTDDFEDVMKALVKEIKEYSLISEASKKCIPIEIKFKLNKKILL